MLRAKEKNAAGLKQHVILIPRYGVACWGKTFVRYKMKTILTGITGYVHLRSMLFIIVLTHWFLGKLHDTMTCCCVRCVNSVLPYVLEKFLGLFWTKFPTDKQKGSRIKQNTNKKNRITSPINSGFEKRITSIKSESTFQRDTSSYIHTNSHTVRCFRGCLQVRI